MYRIWIYYFLTDMKVSFTLLFTIKMFLRKKDYFVWFAVLSFELCSETIIVKTAGVHRLILQNLYVLSCTDKYSKGEDYK